MRARAIFGTAVLLVGLATPAVALAAPPPPPPSGPIIVSVDNGGRACSTTASPPLVLGAFANLLEAYGTDATPTMTGTTQYAFAIWPVADPTAETDIVDTTVSGQRGWVTVPDGVEIDGGTYAWHVRMTDDNGTSPWSTTCVFAYDATPPPAPTVSSSNFPPYQQGAGPIGQLAQFTFSGGGNTDVAGFLYGWGGELPVPVCSYSGPQGQLVCPDPLSASDVVRADQPGGTASVSLSPPDAGPQTMSVEALDAAGNISSPPVSYEIYVPFSGPTITQLSAAPICGNELQVEFAPHDGVTGVTAYWYSVNSAPPVKVAANSDGTAQAKITVSSDSFLLSATSESANGFGSSPGYLPLSVNPQPTVSANVYVDSGQPVGGVGVADTFTFGPPFDGNVVSGYRYRFTGGASGVVAADPSTESGSLSWAPTRPGPQTLTVSAVNADGSGTSCPLSYSFTVATPRR